MPFLSPHEEILDAAVAIVSALDLETAAGTPLKIMRRMALTPTWAAEASYPCCVISPAGIESPGDATNLSDMVGYPLIVRICDSASAENEAKIPLYLSWRYQIRQALSNVRLGLEADGVHKCSPQSAPVVEADLLAYDLLSMPLSFNVETEEVVR